MLTLQQRRPSQCSDKLQAEINLSQNGLLATKAEDGMPRIAICGKRGRCYTDLQLNSKL